MIVHVLPAGTSVPTAVVALTDLLILTLAAIILGWALYKALGFGMAWFSTRKTRHANPVCWDHRGNPVIIHNTQGTQ